MDENSILSYLNFARQLNESLIKGQTSPKSDLNMEVTAAINNTDALLTAINSIKTELCRLPLNFCEREYIENCVNPILIALFFLSFTSYELAFTVSILSSSPIVPPKKSKLKKTIRIIYNINEECEELYKLLKKRLEPLIQDNINC
ncbi:hypothetical protein G9F72_006065 [Clostridium estertheticum]|uniref:hypothetical protein n=1 Tax=Clostridium estertheticum TaxID=238834 RepID=UPI0013E94201|nr:hypothetical protein [Clostridium estertheticum]MBZ9685907.1 hypothetical protein [Clostridium estertheticum]